MRTRKALRRANRPAVLAAGVLGAVLLTAATAVPAPAATTAATATATASGRGSAPSPTAGDQDRDTHTVEITSTADTLTAPSTTTPGDTVFRATTTAEGSGWIGLARPREGVSWETFHDAMRRTLSNDPQDVVEGSRELNASATLLGGVVIHADFPGAFTQHLSPGRYLLFDYLDLASAPRPRYRTLTVSGERGSEDLPAPSAVVVSASVPGAGPRFLVLGTVRAGKPVRFANAIPGQINEAVFIRVKDGTTEAELGEFIDGIGDDGQWPPDPPFISFGLGSLPLSGGQSSVVQVPLQKGRYALLTFIKDGTDGTMLAKKGQYALVDVE